MTQSNNIVNQLSSYDYFLPKNLIATSPTEPRENAKMLVFNRQEQKIYHSYFKNLSDFIEPTNIIFNDTKVIKARIFGKKSSGADIEIMINQPISDDNFNVFIKGRVKKEMIITLKYMSFKVINLLDDGSRVGYFFDDNKKLNKQEVFQIIQIIGHVPLPPYIKRKDIKDDENWYQSIFAKNEGAVAAPTASLHFSTNLIENLKIKNFKIDYITLHVGAGTFKGVETQDITKHQMHSEFYTIPDSTQKIIDSNQKILAVGTTVTRSIEFYARHGKKSGYCDLFLHPKNPPIRVNHLITNFHLPKSTLIMLVSSFIGLEKTKEIYQIAIDKGYKFYSYGDGMLII